MSVHGLPPQNTTATLACQPSEKHPVARCACRATADHQAHIVDRRLDPVLQSIPSVSVHDLRADRGPPEGPPVMTSSTVPTIRWAVLGPGSIARRFASQLSSSPGASLVAVGSSDLQRARLFAAEQAPGAEVHLGSYDEILADPGVDAVYVATVHTTHPRLTIAALEAGKHVLCEKPLAANHAAVMAMAEAARATGKVLVEAYMYRFHPQTRRVLELVADGAIGDVLHVDAELHLPRWRAVRSALRPGHRRWRHPRRRRLPRVVRAGHRRRRSGRDRSSSRPRSPRVAPSAPPASTSGPSPTSRSRAGSPPASERASDTTRSRR